MKDFAYMFSIKTLVFGTLSKCIGEKLFYEYSQLMFYGEKTKHLIVFKLLLHLMYT